MRPVAVAIIVTALFACSNQPAASPSPSPVAIAQTKAADLRTHLDLLLAEHVMIVAKETSAAVYHSDEYASYTALLSANTSDLTTIFGRAFGTTAAAQFTRSWDTQNGYLVDYAIRVASHDDDKANAAVAGLTGTFVPQFGQMIEGSTGLPATSIRQVVLQQIQLDKTFIDDAGAQKYATFYADLDQAYAHSSQLADVLARNMVARFPDKFPGDASANAVGVRVANNLLLQEHSYLLTMATAAAVAGRGVEQQAAAAALAAKANSLHHAWSDWDAAVEAYAKAADLDGPAHVDSLMSASGAPIAAVRHYVESTARVVDDQKAKVLKTLADDDRAAATAVQPIADASVQR